MMDSRQTRLAALIAILRQNTVTNSASEDELTLANVYAGDIGILRENHMPCVPLGGGRYTVHTEYGDAYVEVVG